MSAQYFSIFTNVQLLIIFVLSLLWCLSYNIKRINLYLCGSKLPGPLALPVIGSGYIFMFCSPKDIQAVIRRLIERYGRVIKFWLGPELNIIIAEPKLIKAVLISTNTLQKGPSYKYMRPYLGFGLLSGWGGTWRHQRKTISQCFHSKILEKHFSLFKHYAKELVENLAPFSTAKQFDIFHLLSNCTNDIVCETLLGIKVDDEFEEHRSFVHNIDKIYGLVFLRMSKCWYQINSIFNCSKYYKLHMDMMRRRNHFCEYFRLKKIKNNQFYLKHNVPLDSIIDSQTTLEQFNGRLMTLHTASQEATATICGFVLMALGIHQNIQNKLYKDINKLYEENKEGITIEEINHSIYLDVVIKETLRLFPIGSVITRFIDKEFQLTDDLTLPGGTTITIPIFAVHRDLNSWHRADEFIPERFLPEHSAGRHPFSYLPFSYGPMNCIGQKYAIWLIKTMVFYILLNYEIGSKYSSVSEIELMTDISIRPIHGYLVCLSPRKRCS